MAIDIRMVLGAGALALAACGSPDGAANGSTTTTTSAVSSDASPKDAGRRVFRECAVCHVVGAPGSREAGLRLIGPNLYGVIGRKAGAVEGFTYSPAMLKSGLVWDEATLDRYLERPTEVVPGNRMSYVGEKDPAKRAAIIAYLKEKSASQ